MSINFPCYEKGQRLTANAAAVAVALAGTSGRVMAAKDILLRNAGPLDVTVLCGNSAAVADADCMTLPAGSMWVFGKGPTTHLSAYCSSGTQEISVFLGQGA